MRARRFGIKHFAVATVAIFPLLVYLNNTSRLADPIGSEPVLIAHRALGQDFDREGLTGATCTASRMILTGHDYLENTIPAMTAAFAYGADFVEFDVQRTTDDRFAVFHDWTLDCRTNGSGVTREHTLEELQTLDVGFGYTADGGKTWPFRGLGAGLMPSLEEVLATFPDRNFVIDVKSNDPEEGVLLAERLAVLGASHKGEIMVYGGAQPVSAVRDRLPHIRTISRPRLKRCLVRYLALGWSGYVPSDCARSMLTVPVNFARWLWGWPNRFLQRMDKVDTRVVLIGDYHGEGFSQGLDDPERLTEIPSGYAGAIWTDRIDLIGPGVANERHSIR